MATLREKGIGEAALKAMGRVDRIAFLPSEQRGRAYEDRALAIGLGQTCSQPWIVAVVVQALDLRPGASVLEVGAGSGYLAAVLRAAGAGNVVAVELIPQLAVQARRNLNRAGVSNVQVLVRDGRRGAPEHGTFGAVVVSAATRAIPSILMSQVALPGKLVAPVIGPQGERLWCLTRGDPSWTRQDLGECRFVPLLGESEQAPAAVPDPPRLPLP
ncbi:MAG: methyltransferase domain-containing protein [Candidatus Dormiibacterota bacterium]